MSPTGHGFGGIGRGDGGAGRGLFPPFPLPSPSEGLLSESGAGSYGKTLQLLFRESSHGDPRIAVNCAAWSEDSIHGSASAQPRHPLSPSPSWVPKGLLGSPLPPGPGWAAIVSQTASLGTPCWPDPPDSLQSPRSALQPPKPVPPCGTLHLTRNRAPRDSPSLFGGSVTPQAAPTAQSRAGSVPTCCLRFPGL